VVASCHQQAQNQIEDTMPELSIRGYAKHRGVSHTAVEKAIQQGRIQTAASGLIDVAEADKEWSRNSAPAGGSLSSGPSYAQSRAVHEAYLARLAKLEFEQRSGQLLDKDEVAHAITNMVSATRDNLLGIPSRVSAILAAESDERRVYDLLDDEIRQTLTALSQNLRLTS
jgi:hypothetical protein